MLAGVNTNRNSTVGIDDGDDEFITFIGEIPVKTNDSLPHSKKSRNALVGLKSGSLFFARNGPEGFTGYVRKVAVISGKSPPVLYGSILGEGE